jgi:hypothetical protein
MDVGDHGNGGHGTLVRNLDDGTSAVELRVLELLGAGNFLKDLEL